MAQTHLVSRKRPKSISEIELRPDGWARFEAAVDAAIKSGPKHRTTPKKTSIKKKTRSKDAARS